MAHAAGASTQWALDMLGNWNSVTTDDNGDGSFGGSDTVEEREHNMANELTSLDPDGTGGAPAQPFSYDDAGNLREGRGRIYTHDAWNRLVHVETDDVSPIELGEYEYNGLHWRSVKRSDTSQTPDGLDEERLLYYNAAWQLIEERIDEDYPGDPGTDSIAELFWGIRYIDDLMLRRVDEDAGGTTFKRWHPLTDAQFSVRAVLRDDAGVHERINYSPYGVAEHHWGGDVDGDRSGDFFDILALGDQVGLGDVDIGEANYVAEMDLNRDGTLDGDDASAMVTGTALPAGWISAAGAGNPGNIIGFDGYVFNPEIETYTVRFRWYDPELGRWLQRDPAGYVDGMNVSQYGLSNPARYVDSFGGTVVAAGEPTPDDNPTPDQVPPCKDDNGNSVSLSFDGSTLAGDGFCATMVSGSDPEKSGSVTVTTEGVYVEEKLTFDYSKERQRLRNKGPMPEGCYYFRSDHEDSAKGTNNPQGQPSNRHRWWPRSRGWGDFSWPLTPYPETDVNDSEGNPRSGFFLHGGASPGSAGCGDLCNDADSDLHTFMEDVRKSNGSCYVKVCAQYDSDTKTIVRRRFAPWGWQPGSMSPWMGGN